jgi:hypothetical protein
MSIVNEHVIRAIAPIIKEASERLNWREPDYNEQAHVEITLTVGEIRALDLLVRLATCGRARTPVNNGTRNGNDGVVCQKHKGHSGKHEGSSHEWA